MTFNTWGFIYLGTGDEDPATDRAVIDSGGLRTTIVAVANRDQLLDVASALVADSAQSLELCGAFTAADVAAVREAIGDAVPVGAVRYDMDAVPQLARMFA